MSQPPGLNLTLSRQGNQGYTIKVGSAALPEIKIDIAALTPEQRAGEHFGGRLLLSAVLACFTNTLAHDLTQAGVNFSTLGAQARMVKDKDSSLRTHYSHVELAVTVDADPAQAEAFERVRQGLLGGSLVTYSLESGIEFTYEIERGTPRPFDQAPADPAQPAAPPAAPAPVVKYRGGEGPLFLLNTAREESLVRLRLLGGDEERNLLLVSDGVYLAREGMVERLKELGAAKVFAEAAALAERGITPAPGVEPVSMDRMASLLLEEADRVTAL